MSRALLDSTGALRWFGQSWGAPLNEECPLMPTPVGEPCSRCAEPIESWASGVLMWHVAVGASGYRPLHLECFLRGTTGSIAHVERRCHCYVPGSDEGDPEGLTPREASRLAVWTFFGQHAGALS